MPLLFKSLAVATLFTAFAFIKPKVNKISNKPVLQKTQVAILLDVSGSMDGLIEQAKAAQNTNEPTLESAVEKKIKEQAKRYNMKID